MGSYNSTCMVTHLPVSCGDPVALILLKPQWDPTQKDPLLPSCGHGWCYSWDVFAPFPFAIYGKYNDYGSIEIDDDPEMVGHVERAFNQPIGKVLDMATDRTQEPDPESGGYRFKSGPWYSTMVHRDVWNALTLPCVPEDSWNGREDFETVEDFWAEAQKRSKAYLESIERAKEGRPGVFDDSPRLGEIFLSMGHILSVNNDSRRALIEPDKLSFPLVQRMWDLRNVSNWLSTTRRMWIPQSGLGSSADNLREHRAVLGLAAQVIAQKVFTRHQKRLNDGGWDWNAEDGNEPLDLLNLDAHSLEQLVSRHDKLKGILGAINSAPEDVGNPTALLVHAARRLNVDISKYDVPTPTEELFQRVSTHAGVNYTFVALHRQLVPYECHNCGLCLPYGCDEIMWSGQALPLILVPEDGDTCNCELENLSFMCDNCLTIKLRSQRRGKS